MLVQCCALHPSQRYFRPLLTVEDDIAVFPVCTTCFKWRQEYIGVSKQESTTLTLFDQDVATRAFTCLHPSLWPKKMMKVFVETSYAKMWLSYVIYSRASEKWGKVPSNSREETPRHNSSTSPKSIESKSHESIIFLFSMVMKLAPIFAEAVFFALLEILAVGLHLRRSDNFVPSFLPERNRS